MVDAQEQIEKFQEFFETHYKKEMHRLIRKGLRAIEIDFAALSQFDVDLAEELLSDPEDTVKAAEIATQHFDFPEKQEPRVRFFNLPQSQHIKVRDIRSEHIGKLIAVHGIVRQASDVRPQVTSAKFECPSCGNMITIVQLEQNFKEPSRCSCGRRGRFRLMHKDLVDAQRLIIEEAPESLEGGEQPKRINCFLKEDLVEPYMEKKTTPGAKVVVSGVLNEVPLPGKTGGTLTRFDLAVEALHLEPVESTFEDIEITPEDEEQIKRLAKDPKIFEKLTNSIAPSVLGHDDIKGALVLQLMGGIRKEQHDGTATKGDIHVLLVGDPGAAKSTLLVFMSKAAPKARYVAGKGSTGTGLTATVVRDEFLRGWALEAGTIVLANGGLCAIDEMDKMSDEDTSALHEAMAQQSYHPETEIMFADGSIKKIGPFVENLIENNSHKIEKIDDCELLETKHFEILTTNFQKIYPTQINRVSRHKAPQTFVEIEYSNGRKIVVTPEHPVFIYDQGIQECEAINVKSGMLAPTPQKLPTKQKRPLLIPSSLNKMHKPIAFPQYITLETARLLGYITSEGHSYFQNSNSYAEIGISNTDNHLLSEANTLFTNAFSTTTNINQRKPETHRWATKNLFTTRIFSLPLHNFFTTNFLTLTKKAPFKRVGNIIRRINSNLKLQLLQTAFKGGGLVDDLHIGYCTASYGLAKDYQDLLLQQGIYSYIQKRKRTSYYKIIISGTVNLEKFYHLIVQHDDPRLYKIKQIIAKSNKRNNTRDLMPRSLIVDMNQILKSLRISNGYFCQTTYLTNREKIVHYMEKAYTKLQICKQNLATENIRTIRRSLNITIQEIAHELHVSNSTVYNYERQNKLPLETIKKLATNKITTLKKKLDNVKKLVYSDIRFVKIKNVRTIKNKNIKWVYDITVEPTRTFVSEGLILHNSVTISKANIQATLRARTTVLAAANPKFGRFDPYQPIASQIDLPPALINRFDLIFPVRDLPDKDKDGKIASHILSLHQNVASKEAEIDTTLMKKYVAYVRQNVYPKLSASAIEEIKNFYVTLRNSGQAGDDGVRPIPISARQLEALIRLAEASARLRLSTQVTRKDAKRAIAILRYCLMQVGFDHETGQIDIDRISTGVPASTRNKLIIVRDIITSFGEKGKKTIPLEDIFAEASEKNLTEAQVEEIIEKLKREGEIYEPRSGWISKI